MIYGSLLFEIKDNKDELHRVVVSDIGSILTINDDFMTKQVMARNIHMTEQKIQHMQVDCASVFAADCSVEKMEIGIFSVVNQYKNLSGAQENIAYKMDKLELRDMNVGILDLYAGMQIY